MTIETNPMPTSGGPGGFQEIVKRFWGFDHLIGSVLIKIIYYIGLVFILLFTVMAMFGGGLMGAMMGDAGGGGGALMFIIAPILGVIYLCFWRFICEMWLLMYLIFNRMGEIRDRLPPR